MPDSRSARAIRPEKGLLLDPIFGILIFSNSDFPIYRIL